MNQFTTLINVLKKYRFFYPVPVRDQKKIFKAKKRSLKKILYRSKFKMRLTGLKIGFYYRMRSFGINIRLATSSRIINSALSAAIITIIISSVLTVHNYMQTTTPAEGTVTFVLGKASITPDKGVPRLARITGPVHTGDTIETAADSHISFQVPDYKVITVMPKTRITVNALSKSGSSELQLMLGTVLSKLNKLKKGEKYRIRTGNAIAAVRGTQFSVSYDPNIPKTVLCVTEGTVEVQLLDAKGEAIQTKQIKKTQKAIITDTIVIKPVSEIEALTLEYIAPVSYISNIDKKSPQHMQEGSQSYTRHVHKIAAKIQYLEYKKTGKHLYTIYLYNGKKIHGFIESRGSRWKILTRSGFISISGNSVKTIK